LAVHRYHANSGDPAEVVTIGSSTDASSYALSVNKVE